MLFVQFYFLTKLWFGGVVTIPKHGRQKSIKHNFNTP